MANRPSLALPSSPMLALIFFALLAAAQTQQPAPPADAIRTSFVNSGNLAGEQVVWTTPDGVQHVTFEFNDRGRGPHTQTDYHFDADHNISSATTTGNDYLKASADESFQRNNDGTATWKNRSEAATKSATAPSRFIGGIGFKHTNSVAPQAFYLGMFSPPEEIALLVRVALANRGSIALLPSGEATVKRSLDLTLKSAASQQAHVTEYIITGLDFTPSYLWLDDNNNLFAAVDGNSGLIREGFEPSIKTLSDAQQQQQTDRSRQLAHRLMHRPEGDILIHDVTLFDSTTAQLIPHQDVLIHGSKIQSVGPTAVPQRKGVQVINGEGEFLIPGLWDLHAHVGPNDGMLNLAVGVTTVRDMGNDIADLTARRQRIAAGDEIGTRIIPCGLIDGTGPYHGPTDILADNEEQARAFVDKFAALGYPQIKIYSSVKPELVPAIIDEARKHHMRVSGHIPAGMTAAEAVRDGYNEIQHANFLMLNFWPEVKNTETPARFTEVAKRGADLDINSPAMNDFIALLKDKNIDLDVTLNVFEEMFTSESGHPSPTVAPVADRLPPQVVRNSLSVGLPMPDAATAQRYRASYDNMERMVKKMYDAGIPIESGTDALAGVAYDRELELHQHLGIPPARILQDATLTAAHIMSKDSELGSIAPGKLADLVLLDADPTQSISNVRKTRVVIKDGILYYPAELDRELGIKP